MPLFLHAAKLRIQDQWQAALTCLDQALSINPGFVPAYVDRALVLAQLGRFDESLHDFDHFLNSASPAPEIEALRQEMLKGAFQQFDQLLAINQQSLPARQQRAALYCALHLYQDAANDCRILLSLAPPQVDILNTLGTAQLGLDLHQDALRTYLDAAFLHPEHAEIWYNLGNVRQQLGHLDQARSAYQCALDLTPDLAEAKMEIGHCFLLEGNFQAGWPYLEWRWQTRQLKNARLQSGQPLWLGDATGIFPSKVEKNLNGKTLLLSAEQGSGDSLQLLRFVPGLAEHAGKIILRIQNSLKPLVEPLHRNVEVIGEDEALPPHDLHCPLLSLPLALGLNSLPAFAPYLQANAAKVEKWNARLGHKTHLRIGIAWAGRQFGTLNRTRDIALATLAPLFELNIDFISLQKQIPEAEQKLLDQMPQLQRFESELTDFAETAALIETLDLLISVDTAVAHLAGALGKPCWLLLRYGSEWRWQRERSDSPWYPTLRIFRQPSPGDWESVIANIGDALHFDSAPNNKRPSITPVAQPPALPVEFYST